MIYIIFEFVMICFIYLKIIIYYIPLLIKIFSLITDIDLIKILLKVMLQEITANLGPISSQYEVEVQDWFIKRLCGNSFEKGLRGK